MNKPEEGLYSGHFINFKDIVGMNLLCRKNLNMLKCAHHHISRIFNNINANTKDKYFDNYIFALCNECMFLMSDYLTCDTDISGAVEVHWSVFYNSLLNILSKIMNDYTSTEYDGCISKQEAIYICNLLLYSLDMDFIFCVKELTDDDCDAYFKGYCVLYKYDTKLGDYVENTLRTKIIHETNNDVVKKILHYILDTKYSLNITKYTFV